MPAFILLVEAPVPTVCHKMSRTNGQQTGPGLHGSDACQQR
ncbi:MAG: hypothetical protein WKG03_19790 [Telluria sp.]